MSIQTIIFDLDGTLLDTLGDLTDAVNAALTKRGYGTRSEEQVRTYIGNGIRKLMERALPAHARAETDACLLDFIAHYRAHLTDRTLPYDGVLPLLDELRRRNVTLAVLSNKVQEGVDLLVQHYFGDLIAVAVGEREGVPRKPDPTAVHEILRLLGADNAHTIYVGDSGTDMQTAKNAGLFAVGVTWGFRSRADLLEHGADACIDYPEELLKLLED